MTTLIVVSSGEKIVKRLSRWLMVVLIERPLDRTQSQQSKWLRQPGITTVEGTSPDSPPLQDMVLETYGYPGDHGNRHGVSRAVGNFIWMQSPLPLPCHDSWTGDPMRPTDGRPTLLCEALESCSHLSNAGDQISYATLTTRIRGLLVTTAALRRDRLLSVHGSNRYKLSMIGRQAHWSRSRLLIKDACLSDHSDLIRASVTLVWPRAGVLCYSEPRDVVPQC